MAHGLAHIHDRCVVVADIATKNLLLSADLSIRFCDFSESSILPLNTDMERVDERGYSIYTDMGQLGAVMYEVVTGYHCEFDLFRDQPSGPACAAWPRRDILPSTQDVWLGSIIERCWVKNAFQNARSLLAALELVTLDCPLEHEKKIYEHLGPHANVLADFEISLLPDRTLDKYLSQTKLNRTRQLNCMREAAAAVSYAHSKRVLIGGFTARNFLIADGQRLKLCYLGNSRVVPEHLDIGEVNEDSLSFKHDIACFGSLIYNVVTGEKFEARICQPSNPATWYHAAISENENYAIPDRMAEARRIHFPNWPWDRELPNTEGIFLGNIIQDCWALPGYMRMEDVCSALSELSKQDRSMLTGKSGFRVLRLPFVPVLAVAAGSLVFIAFRRATRLSLLSLVPRSFRYFLGLCLSNTAGSLVSTYFPLYS
ncbi:uncharacterized protein CIMG_10356 [Coccidioides immitis RS]|uniref:Protein kinase domain-containing protein n=4 Tax=Coccidioides TaxID=5500 RepID=J3K018_COCIM|nr:uncharacterized protein CIMG_10356 [Coccidioides immitis RS]EAS27154.3 hypothetical protein CIMG_10356 [Coccidioides immitis RS]